MRSSNGRIKLSPCVVGTVSEMNQWETWLDQLLPSIYDNPIGYSLRDLDDSEQSEISDVGVVRRIRLNCYAIENILLCNESLEKHNFTADQFLEELENWLARYPSHQSAGELSTLVSNFDRRRTLKIKALRNVIVALLGSAKPWEVIVGQVVATCASKGFGNDPDSLGEYLGEKAIRELFS